MPEKNIYNKLAKYYDKIYSWYDYRGEVKFIKSLMKKYKVYGKRVLDMACGTGTHAKILSEEGYSVIGVDKSQVMLNIARDKNKNGKFIEGSKVKIGYVFFL